VRIKPNLLYFLNEAPYLCSVDQPQAVSGPLKPYYVVPETYTSPLAEETKGVKDVIPMPEYKIELPDEKLIRCMAIINERTNGEITKHDLKDLAKERNLIHVAEKKVPGKKRTKKRIQRSIRLYVLK
jgi:hypothetical protein